MSQNNCIQQQNIPHLSSSRRTARRCASRHTHGSAKRASARAVRQSPLIGFTMSVHKVHHLSRLTFSSNSHMKLSI